MALLKMACERFFEPATEPEPAPAPAPAKRGLLASTVASLPSQDVCPPCAPPPSKRKRIGTFQERWAARCVMSNIITDIACGCRCRNECVSNFRPRDVYDARRAIADKGTLGAIRAWLRDYLEKNKNGSAAFGHNLHLDESNDEVCVAGFELFYGFAPGFLYKFRNELAAGISQDDPNLGGRRHTDASGSCAAAAGESTLCDDDSIKYMSAHGWWKELREDIEHQPNTRDRQLDFIEVNELYKEYVEDQRDVGATEDAIASQVNSVRSRGALSHAPRSHAPRSHALARSRERDSRATSSICSHEKIP